MTISNILKLNLMILPQPIFIQIYINLMGGSISQWQKGKTKKFNITNKGIQLLLK